MYQPDHDRITHAIAEIGILAGLMALYVIALIALGILGLI